MFQIISIQNEFAYLYNGKCPIEIKAITNINKDDASDNSNDFVKLYLSYQYHDHVFKEISLSIKNFERDCQQKIMEQIIDNYRSNKFLFVKSIYGEPKKGKSFIGKLLHMNLNLHIVLIN